MKKTMKKSRAKLYVLTAVICAAFFPQMSGSAQNAESSAQVEFVAGTGPTYPVHPEDPDTNENGGAVVGSLAIVSVSHFDFGTIPVAATSQFFDITTTMPNIQVVDLRGTATGWSVTAAVSSFTNDAKSTLPGAAIHISNGRPNSSSSSDAPSQAQNTILTTDGMPAPILSAASGAGTGLWVMRWYPPGDEAKYVNLEVPAGSATLGNHTATINWILGDTP